MTGEPDPVALGTMRNAAHGNGGTPRLYPEDPARENIVGAIGEVWFARLYGLKVNEENMPEGDGGIDFVVNLNGRDVAIDVKCAQRRPPYLLVKESHLHKHPAADFYVLGMLDRGQVTFVGWETRGIMALMPTGVFNSDVEKSYFRRAESLRPMQQLTELFSLRTECAP